MNMWLAKRRAFPWLWVIGRIRVVGRISHGLPSMCGRPIEIEKIELGILGGFFMKMVKRKEK